ncbi:MAG: hypothetical protein M5U28_36500 [Sandaracinaceae bacterium]|nr:hypothetical protein [Sandaracinaceae bacterium]
MTSFGPWLKPTLLGPLLTTWGLTTLGSVLVGMHALSGGRFDSWLVGMLVASFFGAGLGVLLIAVDVVLLKAKLRSLPDGGARLDLVPALAARRLLHLEPPLPAAPESVAGTVLFIVAPMTAACFGARLLFGARPSAAG